MKLRKLCFSLALVSLAGVAAAQKYRDASTTAIELMQLPKYCHAQYIDEKLSSDPQYSIQGCGVYTNHFCPGLIRMSRGQKISLQRDLRREEIRIAKDAFNYTLIHMPEKCWLRQDAESALARAKIIEASIR
jgi:hypothetical protein